MIKNKISKGQFLNFGIITTAPQQLPGSKQVSLGCVNRQIGNSTKESFLGPTRRVVADGLNNSKENRNFIWLPWAENAINYTESQGRDVLSGLFTGCYMVAYKFDGVRRIGHISTPSATAAWNTLVAASPLIEIIGGFRPSDGYGVGVRSNIPMEPGSGLTFQHFAIFCNISSAKSGSNGTQRNWDWSNLSTFHQR